MVPNASQRTRSPYSESLLADLENRLLWARARIGREFESLVEDTLPVDEQRADHPSERGSDEYAQSVNLQVLQHDADALWQIEEALERIAGRGDGPYGLCQHCAVAPQHLCPTCPWIPEERLIAVPWATNCAQVQERLDRHELQPPEAGEPEAMLPGPVRVRTRVRALDRAVAHVHPWLLHAQRVLGCEDREHAFSALRRTLHALRDRLPVTEAAHLGAQLPVLLRGVFYEGWRPAAAQRRDRSREEFLADIVRGLPGLPHPPEAMARAAFQAIEAMVSPGEVEDVKQALPRHVRALWVEE